MKPDSGLSPGTKSKPRIPGHKTLGVKQATTQKLKLKSWMTGQPQYPTPTTSPKPQQMHPPNIDRQRHKYPQFPPPCPPCPPHPPRPPAPVNHQDPQHKVSDEHNNSTSKPQHLQVTKIEDHDTPPPLQKEPNKSN